MNITKFKKMSGSVLSILLACAVVLTSALTTTIQSKAATPSITDPKGYSDDFDSYSEGETIHEKNGWISQCRGTEKKSHIVTAGALKVEDFSTNDGWRTNIINRPMTDAMLDQYAKVDVTNFNDVRNNATTNIHLRMQYTVTDYNASSYNPGPSNAYIATFSAGEIYIYSYTGISSSGTWNNSASKTEVANDTYEHKDGHSYTLEFKAEGAFPTTLTATIYDKTANKIVATATGTNNDDALQKIGTVGLSHTRNGDANSENRHFALFDNFEYRELGTTLCHDDFERTGTEIGNSWSGPTANTTYTLTGSGFKVQKNDAASNGVEKSEHEAAMVRPVSEKSLNSTVEVEYTMEINDKEKQGIALYSRIQGERPTDDNCYRVVITYYEAWNNNPNIGHRGETIRVYAGTKLLETKTNDYGEPTVKHRLSISVKSLSTTVTEITVFSYKFENGIWKRRVAFKCEDDTEALQNAGTAGFTIHKKWNSSIARFDDFRYVTSDSADDKPLMDVFSFKDNFDRADGDINGNNGWESVSHSIFDSHEIVDNALKVTDFKYSPTYIWNGACTAVTARPFSEAYLNQKASVEIIEANKLINAASANLHLRTSKAGSGSRTSYFAEVTSGTLKIKRTASDWTVKEIPGAIAAYEAVEGHIYNLEFVAEDIYPTKLTATLYDVTDGNKVVATATGENSEDALQRIGVAALSVRGSNDISSVNFDNFSYRQSDNPVAQDNFNRTDIIIGRDWIVGSKSDVKFSEGHLVMGTTAPNDQGYYIEDSAIRRPNTEIAHNQLVEVDFSRSTDAAVENMGAVVYARVQGDTLTNANNYRAAAVVGWNGAGNWDGRLIVNSGTTELINEKIGGMDPNAKYRLQLAVSSISNKQH